MGGNFRRESLDKGAERRDLANQIKRIVTMEDVLRRRGFQTGRNRRIPCPIHNGKNPNFSYKGSRYNCFKCHASGSVIDFVMWSDGLTLSQAIDTLAREYGLGDMVVLSTDTGSRLASARLAKAAREQAHEERKKNLQKDMAECMHVALVAMETGPVTDGEYVAIREYQYMDFTEKEIEHAEDTGTWKEIIAGDVGARMRELCDTILGDKRPEERKKPPDFVPMYPELLPDHPSAEAGVYSGEYYLKRFGTK